MAKSRSVNKSSSKHNTSNKNNNNSAVNPYNTVNNTEFNIIESISNNKFLIGLVAIFVNIGSRYIEFNFTNNQELLMRSVAKEVLIFAITLMMTRDIIIAIILTTVFIILSNFIFNDQSKFCVLPEKYKRLDSIIDSNKDGVVTEEEIKNAEKILQQAKNQKELYNKIFMLDNLM
jgi:hypothetical protein